VVRDLDRVEETNTLTRPRRCSKVDFDRLSVGFLTTSQSAPRREDLDDDATQDEHMAHLADLHESGYLLAAGPLSNDHFRGLLIFVTDVDTATELMMADPAVRAGWFDVTIIPWMVPRGAIEFTSAKFPRSLAETY
jgi:uncharacterized protein YciI